MGRGDPLSDRDFSTPTSSLMDKLLNAPPAGLGLSRISFFTSAPLRVWDHTNWTRGLLEACGWH